MYKSVDITDTGNYRPFATLSPFAKVLEHLIYNQLYAFLEKHNILYKHQFDFRKGSTEQAILEITDSLNMAIDNKQITCCIFPRTCSTIHMYISGSSSIFSNIFATSWQISFKFSTLLQQGL